MTENLDFDDIDRTGDATSGTSASGHALVVLDHEAPERTLEAVLGRPGAADDDLHLLLVRPVRTYEERRAARARAGVTAPYSLDGFADETDRDAARLAREWLGRSGAAVDATGTVGRVDDHVRAAVATGTYDRVYVDAPQGGILARLLGRPGPAKTLARDLPAAVSLVALDDGPATDSVPEELADPDVPSGEN